MKKIWYVLLAFAAVIFLGAFIAKAQQSFDNSLGQDLSVVEQTITDTSVHQICQ
jgi:hypothetical protein